MKAFLIAAVMLTLGATAASAQSPWCEEQEARMRRYMRDATRYDGRVDQGEQEVLRRMQRDFEARCLGRRGGGYERPYEDRGYRGGGGGGWCDAQEARMRRYMRDATRYDGRVDQGEQNVLRQMQRDFEARCLGGRFY